jgi:hypothetical protein
LFYSKLKKKFQSKGLDVGSNDLTKMIPISNEPLMMLGVTIPVKDDYEMKDRPQKSIDDMTAMQVVDAMYKRFKQIEKSQVEQDGKKSFLYMPNVTEGHGQKVLVKYISYQTTSELSLEEAKDYLKFLLSIKTVEEFKHHWHYKGENNVL